MRTKAIRKGDVVVHEELGEIGLVVGAATERDGKRCCYYGRPSKPPT